MMNNDIKSRKFKYHYPCGLEYMISERKDSDFIIAQDYADEYLEEILNTNKGVGITRNQETKKHLKEFLTNRVSEYCEFEFSGELCVDTQLQRKCDLNGVFDKKINNFINPTDKKLPCCRFIEDANNPMDRCFCWLAYIDLIGFKPFNDYLSEDAGDVILAYFANYITQELGKIGFLVARKGGEEFNAYYMDRIQDRKDNGCKLLYYEKRKVYGQDPRYEPYEGLRNNFPDRTGEDMEKGAKIPDGLINFCKTSFMKQILVLYIPKGGVNKRVLLLASDDRNQDNSFCKNFLFRLPITGVGFRYGLGKAHFDKGGKCTISAEDDAYAKGQQAKDDEKANNVYPYRGDFGKYVRFGVKPSEAGVKRYWKEPNNHIFLIVPGNLECGSSNAVENNLLGDIKNVLARYGLTDLSPYWDEICNVTMLAIKFNESMALNRLSRQEKKERLDKLQYKLHTKQLNDVDAAAIETLAKEIKDEFEKFESKSVKDKFEEEMLNDALDVLVSQDILDEKRGNGWEIIRGAADTLKKVKNGNGNFRDVLNKLIEAKKHDSSASFYRRVASLLIAGLGESVCQEIYTLTGESIAKRYYKTKVSTPTH